MSHQTPCYTLVPLFNPQRHEGIKIEEILIGSSFALADYDRKNWQSEYPVCLCGKSEETVEHFFLACGLCHDIRPEDIDSLNLLDPEGCNTIVEYTSASYPKGAEIPEL